MIPMFQHASCMGLATALMLLPQLAGAEATTNCTPADAADPLLFQCVVKIETGTDLGGAEGQVKITMPSMPMAHNVPPSELIPDGQTPDAYTFDLSLDMFGEWMLTYELVGTKRQRFNQKLLFTPGAPAASDGHGDKDSMDHADQNSHANHDDK